MTSMPLHKMERIKIKILYAVKREIHTSVTYERISTRKLQVQGFHYFTHRSKKKEEEKKA
jgi:hypothetical protein